MSLGIIGPYEILSPLGAGGMGEVFRARDTKLNRDVAIKVLPAAFAQDAERVTRFRREAQLLASFNHPNIAGIYGLEESDGVVALALELVEGEDLAERLKRGPIPPDEAIGIAKQIAEGLEAAHEKGIVHRDLKPANVKLTKDGTVKLLDFGLAKAYEGDAATASNANLSNSPTLSRQMTEAGIILGTAAYMSPEQARGMPLDKRSDIWSFGVLLFEMLTGRRAFRGADVSETLAAVLRDTPAFGALPANTPAPVRRLLARCLERDPRRRLRDIGDARWELGTVEAEPAADADAARTRRRPASLALAGMAAVALAAATAGWMLKPKPLPQAQPLIRASYPIGAPLRLTAQRQQIAISPDGRLIATVVGSGLSVHRVDELAATPIKGTTGVAGVFFSPDSRTIGFTTETAIKKVPVEAGEVSVIAEVPGAFAVALGSIGASWADDGRIYYGTAEGILAVPEGGGAPQVVIRGSNLGHPQVLPGSRLLLFTRGHSPSVFATSGEVVLHSLDGGDDVVLTTGASPRYLKTGHLLVARSSTILAAPLDLRSRRLSKEPVAVAQEVAMLGSFAQYDVSETGTLVHIPGSAESNPASLLRRVGSSGASSPLGRTPREYSDPRVSPDGRLIALHLQDQQNDVWTMDIARDSLTRLTFDPQEDETPVWSPDGLWLAFSGSARQGTGRGIFRRRADGSGVEEVLWSLDQHSHVTDWSRDGQTLVIDVLHPERQADIELLELGATSRLRPYLETPFAESSGRVSPDGRWLAYRSNESGRNEIYVQAFPTAGSKVQVSTNGGVEPLWSRDGRALFYRSDSGLMMARCSGGASLGLQPPVLLFEDSYGRPQGEGHTAYDLLPDGKFVFIKSMDTPGATRANPFLIAAFNWVHDLETRVPVARVP